MCDNPRSPAPDEMTSSSHNRVIFGLDMYGAYILEIERLLAELASERNHVAGLRAEIARLRNALIRIETLADEMMLGRASYVGAIRDTARAALAEQGEK